MVNEIAEAMRAMTIKEHIDNINTMLEEKEVQLDEAISMVERLSAQRESLKASLEHFEAAAKKVDFQHD